MIRVPYGYRLVESEQLNRSGRPKKVIRIHEEEAEIVRMLFDIMGGETLQAFAFFDGGFSSMVLLEPVTRENQ